MAIPVQATSPLQGQQGPVYRLTTKAVRLMKLLNVYVDPSAYPAARYHPDGSSRTVKDEDEDRTLGPEWRDKPFPPKKS